MRGVSVSAPVLVGHPWSAYTSRIQVRVTPDLARQLSDLAASTGRSPDQLVEDALIGIEWQPPQHLLDISRDRRLPHQRSSPHPREA
jgi:hypothetical protein